MNLIRGSRCGVCQVKVQSRGAAAIRQLERSPGIVAAVDAGIGPVKTPQLAAQGGISQFLDICAGLSSARYIVTAPDPVAACRPGWCGGPGPVSGRVVWFQTCRGTLPVMVNTRSLANLAIAPVARPTEEVS